MWKSLSLSRQLFLGIAILGILSLAIAFVVVNTLVREVVHENILESNLRHRQIHAQQLDAWFAEQAQIVGAYSRVLHLIDRAYYLQILDEIVYNYELAQSFWINLYDGSMYDSSRWIPPYWWVAQERPWWQLAYAHSGEVTVTLPYISAETHRLVSTISRHLSDWDGQPGVAAMDIDLWRFEEIMNDFAALAEGYLFLAGPCGEIIIHPNPAYMLDAYGFTNVTEVYDYYYAIGWFFSEDTVLEANDSYFMQFPLESTGWTLVAVMPAYITSVPVWNMLWIVMLTIVFAVGIVAVFTFFYVKWVATSAAESERTANLAKTQFLARMSHEIRTPMNAILGMAELILREEISEQTREQAVIIRHSGSHLLTIINDILDLSKIESGKLELALAEYLPASVINDLINTIKVRLPGRKLRFVLNISSSIPHALWGDSARVYQIIINLLNNAVKYTDKGFVALDMTGERKGDTFNLIVKVRDSGKGIKQEDLSGLFGEFVRLDAEANKNVEGTGLGLAITRSLVHHMGGTIEVESTYGLGSTFTVVLPQIIKDHKKMAKVISPEKKPVIIFERRKHLIESINYTMDDLGVPCTIAETHAQFCKGLKSGKYAFAFVAERLYDIFCTECPTCQTKTKIILVNQFDDESAVKDRGFPVIATPLYSLAIVSILNDTLSDRTDARKNLHHFTASTAKVLIVDDVQVNLKVADGLLKPYQMVTTLCESGGEAIDTIKKDSFDLVLMDYMMPGMSGVEATKAMREAGVSTPIIALTANALVGAKEMFLDAGFDDFLSKPIEVPLLNKLLAKWIPKKKQQQADLAVAVDEAKIDFHINGVDITRGLALSGGNARLYMDIISLVGREYTKKLDALTNHLETGDLHLYTVHVHALKAVFANIGADTISAEAESLENAGESKDIEFIQKNHGNFAKNMKLLIANINAAVNQQKHTDQNVQNSNDVDDAAMLGALHELKTAIEKYDVAAIDKISAKMQNFTSHPTHGEEISEILRLAFVSKYKQAGVLAGKILENM